MQKKNRWGILALLWTTLFSQENDDQFVRSIQFIGNESISDNELRKVVNLKEPFLFSRSEFDRRILKLDAITIKNKYKTDGYLNAAVKDSFTITDNLADVFFIINERDRFYINEISISGNHTFSEKQIKRILKLKKDNYFDPVALNTHITNVEERFHKIGKLFVSIDIQTDITDSVDIEIHIAEGPNVYINKTFIEGADSNMVHFVKRDIYFNNGDLYNLDKILLSQRRLLETAQFSLANIYPVKHAQIDTVVNMVVEVKYFPKREITSEGGFVPIEFGGLILSGPGAFLQWKNRSLFGIPTRLTAKSSVDIPTEAGLQYPRVKMDVNLENQWIFNLRFPTKVQMLYELYKKYGSNENPFIQRYGFNWSSVNRVTETSFIELGIRWEKFDQQDGEAEDVEQRMVSIRSKMDYADDPLFPSNGVVVTGDVYSVGGLLGGTREYQKIDLGIRSYIPLPRRVVFASRVQFGMILNWDESYDQYEEILFEKFYLGGTKSLRGWNALQYPVKRNNETIHLNGKINRFLTSAELRIPISGAFGAECFVDGGQLWDSTSSLDLGDLSWNGGVGLTYRSPLGPIRLDMAYQLDDPTKWELLLDVLYAF